ncbi:hypothetical protein [Bacillus sp. AK128]
MNNNLLYFPNISIPKTPWLYKTLLYWDSIGVISPEHYMKSPDRFEQHMGPLLESGLVKPLMPLHQIKNLPLFKEKFLYYLDNNYTGIKGVNSSYSVRIHFEKMDSIGSELIRRGFAKRTNHWEWLLVKRDVGNLYMSYLATVLAKLNDFTPITNSALNLNIHTERFKRVDNHAIHYNAIRNIIVDSIFPVPLEVENVWDLIRFKEKHEVSLRAFRTKIEEEIPKILSVPIDKRENLIQEFTRSMNEEKRELSERFHSKWRGIGGATFIYSIHGLSIVDSYINNNFIQMSVAALNFIRDMNNTYKQTDIPIDSMYYTLMAEDRFVNNKNKAGQNLDKEIIIL